MCIICDELFVSVARLYPELRGRETRLFLVTVVVDL